MKKEKEKIGYICKMIVKTIIWLLPLISVVMDLIVSTKYGSISTYFDLSMFKELGINLWYTDLIRAIGLNSMFYAGSYWVVIMMYPLYLLWVEIFDLVIHIFLMLPKLGHKLLGEKE